MNGIHVVEKIEVITIELALCEKDIEQGICIPHKLM